MKLYELHTDLQRGSGGLCSGKDIPIAAAVLQSQLVFFFFFFLPQGFSKSEKGEASGSSIQRMSCRILFCKLQSDSDKQQLIIYVPRKVLEAGAHSLFALGFTSLVF